MKKTLYFVILLLILLSLQYQPVFFSGFNPEERAKRYMDLAFEEYRAALRKNPGDRELFEEYENILKAKKGEINARIELALFFRELGMKRESDNLLLDVVLKNKKEAVSYLEHLISRARSPEERIELYQVALEISPGKGSYWYHLGKLYLGLNRQNPGIAALEKAYSCEVKENDLFYYLGKSLIKQGDYKKAEFYINEGLKAKETVDLRRLRYTIYSRQKKQDFLAREGARIKQLLSREKLLEGPSLPESQKKPPAAGKPGIISGKPSYEFLYVAKEQQELLTYRVTGRGLEILDKIPVTTGKNSGPKKSQGDEKTPHGAYLLTTFIAGDTLPAKYGMAAYPLNYPNSIDKRLKRDGNGIWLHGTPIERPPYHSEGCIVVSDKDMKKVMEYISVKRTFVSVGDKDDSQLDPGIFDEIVETLFQWEKGWEGLDIDEYMAHYDEAFYSGGKDKKQLKRYKERINQRKKFIEVDLSEIQIIPYGDTPFGELMLVFFKQGYRSNNFSSSTYKMMYLVNREDGWKIIGEETVS